MTNVLYGGQIYLSSLGGDLEVAGLKRQISSGCILSVGAGVREVGVRE